MIMDRTEIRKQLTEQCDEYRKLCEKHRGYEARLDELGRKSFLSPREELERINLKKYKLRLKDRMETLARNLN